MFNHCVSNVHCASLFNQLPRANFTEFDLIARSLIPGWPVSVTHVQTIMADQATAVQSYLMGHMTMHGCGPNQRRVANSCVHLDIAEVPSSTFVNVLFVMFIVIALIYIGVYIAKHYKALGDEPGVAPLATQEEGDNSSTQTTFVPNDTPAVTPGATAKISRLGRR